MTVAVVWIVALLVLGGAARPPGPRVPVLHRWVVAALLACAVALPALPTCWWTAGAPGRGGPVLMACAILLQLALASVRLPRSLLAFVGGPASIDAAGEVAAVAAAMRMRAPEVLQLRGGGALALTTAMAWGLLRPVVLLGDGIALRLQAAHRRAIVAHELGHLRGRHLLLRMLAHAVWLAAVVAAAADRIVIMAALMVAGTAFLRTLLGQRQELAADAAAARAVGVDDTAAALGEVHAANMLRAPFAGDALFFAVATHPSLAVRAAALGAADPVVQRTAARHRRIRAVVMPLWGALLLGALLAPYDSLAGLLLSAAAVLPVLLQLLLRVPFASQRRDRRALGLVDVAARWRMALLLAGQCAALAGVFTRSIWLILAGIAVTSAGLLLHWRAAAVRLRLQRVLTKGDLAACLIAFTEAAARRRLPIDLAIESAVVRVATGDRDGALRELAALGDHPGVRLHRAWLLHVVDPKAARELLAPLAAALPHNGPVHALLAVVEARVGAFDDARRRIDAMLPLHARDGTFAAVAAEVELRAALAAAAPERLRPGGRAEQMLALAERLSPGDPSVVAQRARFDAATAAPGMAKSLERLRELAQALPLSLIGEQIVEVEAMHAGCRVQ